jgi:hypothetical protein
MVLSALIPGSGQWMQGRSRTALHFFVCWAGIVVFVSLPVAWALDGPKMAVAFEWIALAIAGPLLASAIAAWDAWQLSEPYRVKSRFE